MLWRRFIVVRIDRVDMLVRDAETPVEQLGARSRTEGVEALAESAFEFVGTHHPALLPQRPGFGWIFTS